MSTVVKGALDISNDAFNKIEVGGAWSVHEKACMVDSISDLRTSEGEILEGANKTTIEGGIIKKITVGGRKFGAGIDRRFGGVAIIHTSTLDDIKRVLALREMEPIG
jgi:hypothetical protein